MTGYPSKDKPWLKYYKPDVEKTAVPHHSIYQAIKESNKNRLNRVALDLRSSSNDYKKGIKVTYRQCFQRMEEVAKAYSVMGVKPDEIIITILPNIPESRIAIYGLNIIGATVYPVSPMTSSAQLSQIIKECNTHHLIVFTGFLEKYRQVLNENDLDSVVCVTGFESLPYLAQWLNKSKEEDAIKSIQEIQNAYTWNDLIRMGKQFKGELAPYYSREHTAIIVGTSGTTGVPKGVCLTDDNLNAIALQHGLSGILDEEDVMLDALIQSIGYGISTMHYSTYYGYKVILIPELLTERFPEVLCRTKPDHFTGGPVHCQYLVRSSEFQNGKLPNMKNLVSGGASLPKEVEKTINKVGEGFSEGGMQDLKIVVRQGCGATENGGCGAYACPGAYKFGGLGIPLPLDTISVFKEGTDTECQYGEEGEICICGPTVMKEYFHNAAETEIVLKKHKDDTIWLHTADMGYMDEDGQVFLTGRIKDIFMRNGFNVHPSKIEEFINTLPEVQECKVIGIEHTEEQKVPVAFVVISNDFKDNNKEDLIRSLGNVCFNNLEEMSVPYNWVFVETLPRNIGGKVDVNALKKQYLGL